MNTAAVMTPKVLLTDYPCTGIRLYTQPIVLIHGWGVDSQIWQSLPQQLSQTADILTLDLPGFAQSPALEDYSQASLMEWMAEVLPERCYLLGLSLGGMLSCAFAAQHPERVEGLMTLSSNLSFVTGNNNSQAMPAEQYRGFTASWEENNQDCLKRFCGLQTQGDSQQRQLIHQLRGMTGELHAESGGALLKLLGEIDNQTAITGLNCPTLAIFGEQDALVPVACTDRFRDLNSLVEIAVIEDAGHLPHLSRADEVHRLINSFLQPQQYRLDKTKVAESFGRAASRYDSAAVLQHKIGEQLLSNLNREDSDNSVTTVIDLGCGTGYHCPQLQKQYPKAEIIGVDISSAMLSYAATQYPQGNWLCADAEDLPFEDNSQSLIFSNFALQWCENIEQLASQLYRVLKPQAQLCFAVPGPETLTELRSAWQQVDGRVHVNRFNSLLDWQSALQNAGFSQVELQSENIIQQHQSVRELLMELKDVGARNNNAGKQTTLTGKQHLQALYAAYDGYRQADGRFPATWEIISCTACK
jgi:malonyl-CoA O-methyltransferase